MPRIATLAVAAMFMPQSEPSTGLSRDERALLHPTAAALAPDGRGWLVPVRFCVYEPEQDDPLRAATLSRLRSLLDVRRGTPEAARFAERARLFFVDHERGKRVDVAIGALRFRVGPTGADGCCDATIVVPLDVATGLAPDGRLPLAIGDEGDPTGARGAAWLVAPEGRSVISDVDDTIKTTGVGSTRAVLESTFLRELEAIPGMAELFGRLREPGSAFHYVSLSPWQLAPLLDEFLASAGFPRGSLHLQPFRIQDGDFGDLVGDSRAKKLAAIEPLLATWPKRRFVLVGDAGQMDPEVFGELARRRPEQIERVLIRDPNGLPRDAARWLVAFAGVPAEKWTLFADPATVPTSAR
jgi:phosphatidate phosphatase APP1